MKKIVFILLVFIGLTIITNSTVNAQSVSFKNVSLISSVDSIYSYQFSISEAFDDYSKEVFVLEMRKLIQFRISNIEIIDNKSIRFRSFGLIPAEYVQEILKKENRQINPSDID